MAKQLNVNLSMTADTNQAKVQLQQLQQQLTQLTKVSSSGSGGFGITKEIQEASVAAAQLKVQLKAATDVNTGKLDLSKFNQELIKSNMSISKYHTALSAIGPDGEKAFAQLAASISNADVRITNANSKLSQFAVTLANTARWQISSSVLHGFMGAMSSAYNYAQNLNESLNQIRIVTGQNTDQMAKFAKQANEAAKTLSTTTTSYTNASLIYYQQGLSDSEVKERTDITIKMANAANQSAEIISDQLTAVWNNFAKGSDNLEHYADAMTRLGADTASSTDEIAEGLEKFASVADLIGLSFDNAAAALATVTATTRQSADIVGTAFKTIFARIQGLNLGETLDDGTDLNKYSKALETVGINIKDQNGELKDMDTILDEMGSKWKTLSKDQQTALAQTVAGVRQYTQLVSLMDNWDFYQQNLELAKNSDGSLQEQANIYAESWEAAQKRVRASAEAIYSALLNDKFFIEVNNGFSKFLDLINSTIKGLGGVKGVLLTVGTIITQVFQKQISEALSNFSLGVVGLTKKGKQKVEDLRTQANDELIKNAFDDGTLSGSATASAYKAQGDAQQTLINNAKNMTEEQKNIAQLLLDQNQALKEAALNQAEAARSAEDEATSAKRTFEIRNKINTIQGGKEALKSVTDEATRLGRLNAVDTGLASSAENINFSNINDKKSQTAIKNLQTSIANLQRGYSELGITAEEALGSNAAKAFGQMADAFDKDGNLIEGKIDALQKAWQAWTQAFTNEGADYDLKLDKFAETISGVTKESIKNGTATEEQAKKFAECREQAKLMTESCVNAGQAETEMAAKSGTLVTNLDRIKAKMAEMSQSSISMSQVLTQMSSTIMSAGMIITNITGLIKVWNDDQAELSTKLLTTASTLGMVIPSIISVAKGFEKAKSAVTIFGIETSLAMWQVTLIVGAIVALIAIMAILAKAVYKASPEGVFKSATKAAEEAKDAAEQVKEAYEDLQTSLDNLDSGIEKIESLTRGTLEWRQAIAESNNNLIELLSNYKMLDSKNFTIDDDGVMKLTDEARKIMLTNASSAVQQANNASYGAQVFANNASSRNEASKVASQMWLSDYGEGTTNRLDSSNQLSADVGMAIAEAINQGALKDITNKAQIEKALNSVDNLLLTEKESIASQIAASGDLQQQMGELAIAVAENTAANNVLNTQIIDSTYGTQIQNSGLDETAQDTASQIIGSQLEQKAQELYDSTWKDKGFLGGGKTDAEVQKAYAEAMGWATDTIENQSGNKAKYYSKDGSEIGVISDEVARKYLAQQEALEELGQDVQKYVQDVQDMVQEGDAIAAGVGNELLSFAGGSGGNFNNLTQSGLAAISNQISASVDDNGTLTEDTFKIGNITINEEYAQQLGYDSVQAYYDAIQNAINSGNEAFDLDKLTETWGLKDNEGKVLSNIAGDSFKALIQGIDTSDLTSGAMQNFASAYRKIFEQGGSEALKYVDEIISMSGEHTEEAISALGDIDWSDWDSITGLTDQLTELGIEIDDNLVEQLALATKATKSFNTDEFVTQISEVQDIIKDLSIGDTISAEDYAKLGEGYESYFTLMSDGTYKLTSDAEDFYNAVSQNQRAELLKNLQAGKNLQSQLQDRKTTATEALGTKDISSIGELNRNTENKSYDTKTAQEQLDFIQAMGAATEDQMAVWNAALKDSEGNWQNVNTEILQQISDAATQAAADYNALDNQLENNSEALLNTQQAIFTTATSLEELDIAATQVEDTLGSYNYSAYASGLMNVASQYENCAEEINEFKEALFTGDEATIKAAESELKLAVSIGEASEQYSLDAIETENYAKRLVKSLNISGEEAAKLAIANQRLDRGCSSLNSNLKDYKKNLNAANKGSAEWSKTMDSLKTDLADLLNIADGSLITDQFAEDVLASEDLKKALDGDSDAILRLRLAAADNIIANLEIDDSALASVQGKWEQVKAMIQNETIMAPGADQTELINTFNSMIEEGKLTKEQIESTLAGLNVSADLDVQYNKLSHEVPTVDEYSQVTITDKGDPENGVPPTWKRHTWTVNGEPTIADEWIPQYTIKGTEGEGGVTTGFTSLPAPTVSKGSTTSGSGSGSGGGSKSKSKKPDKSNIVERYKEITDALDDNTRAMDKASKAADRLYGKDRIEYLKKNVSLLKERRKLLEQEQSEIKEYLKKDKEALKEAANAAGVNLTIDPESGNILNYRSELEKLEDRINTLKETAYADKEITDAEQEQIDSLQELIDTLLDAISQYDETNKKFKDNAEDLQDNINETMDENYEILHYELEIKIEVNDLELDKIEYYINKLSDDFYSMAEVAGYMNQKFSEAQDALGYYEGFYNDLNTAFANGEISQEKYIEGLKESYSAILDQLTSLNDLDKEMMHYYEDTLDAAADELSYYTDQLEHLNNVLDHYKNLVTLVNGELDYKSIGKILDGQAKVLKNQLDVASANYKMLLSEKAEIEQSLASAQDEAARELFEKELKAITTKVNEAQEEMLSKTEEWAEAQKAIMENAMAEAAKAMEKEFTDGLGFDALSNSIDRLNSYADEYLTKTNQIYETQKLINTAQQAADKTTNEAAKARLNSYMKEVETLQEKNQLSNLELEIAKAKYDVVLAEIALEEAQNAKSTVRLQRDNEGNFGYVYTANQDDVSKAEQDLADAQNKLYNIGLEGTNEYGQKLLELQQKLADDLIALEEARAAGQYATDEEYYAARDQLISEYNDLFRAYSEQYTTAMGVDANIQQEAWINAYESMINKTGEWQDKTSTYIEKCEESYSSWRQIVEDESEIIDGILNDLESEVDDVTKSSDELYEEVKNKIVPGLKDELVAVRNVTSAYAAQRQQIQELISYYERLTQSILAAIRAQSGLSGSSGSSGVDYSQDFSSKMAEAWEQGDIEAYEKWKQLREEKIAAGYSDWGVSTDWINDYLKNGGELPDGMTWVDLYKQLNGGFATGGFTGAWGPEGKLTFLHEKELVLNKDDTVNFLTATNMLRDISDMIDLKALQDKVSILPYLPGVSTNGSSDTLEQTVTIEAHFPSVTSHSEIEEAFNTLVNRASQYANRK